MNPDDTEQHGCDQGLQRPWRVARAFPCAVIFTLCAACFTCGASMRVGTTRALIQSIDLAIKLYRDATGQVPVTEGETTWFYHLATDTRHGGPFVELGAEQTVGEGTSILPVDGWGHPLVYRCPGQFGDFDVYSIGADGVDDEGEGDDVTSWAGIPKGKYRVPGRPYLGTGASLIAAALISILVSGVMWRVAASRPSPGGQG